MQQQKSMYFLLPNLMKGEHILNHSIAQMSKIKKGWLLIETKHFPRLLNISVSHPFDLTRAITLPLKLSIRHTVHIK